ncbi:MAG: hypothetical protein A2Y10_05565 [Planctomycetes bacterium GWF2_41_51]|nr:MAG: hypothetical protein A2Y10_05565 [Planctomycetes bacterium GWF2_41_51]HBG26773.1 hypothetical protein [Phycisphaerales bacterium]
MNRNLIILCVLAMCSLVLAEEKKTVESEKEKLDYRSVIVDAWLVKIDADMLYQSGVKPLSEKEKEYVSVMNLIWCLSEPNCGEIIASAKTRTITNESASCESSNVRYVKWERGNHTEFSPYSSETVFKTEPKIFDDKIIRLEYVFRIDSFSFSEFNLELPPKEIKLNFANYVVFPDKKPMIACQSQIGNEMYFLVMKAEIVE